jgi:hypothetical protein
LRLRFLHSASLSWTLRYTVRCKENLSFILLSKAKPIGADIILLLYLKRSPFF